VSIESALNIVLALLTIGASAGGYLIGRGKREQAGEDTDKDHTDRIHELEESHSRHILEIGRLTDIAASLNTIVARQDEKLNGLARWMQAIDERVLHVERGKHEVGKR
jgi:hypothetical protein